MKQGHARRNRGNGILNWSVLAKKFPDYREHIYRIRKNYPKLLALGMRLVKKYGLRREKMLTELPHG
jgi:hypothetical protein